MAVDPPPELTDYIVPERDDDKPDFIGDRRAFTPIHPYYATPGFANGPLVPDYYQGPRQRYYRDGDEWEPRNAGQSQIWEIQRAMIHAGLISRDSVTPGFWNQASANAYRDVLELANVYGVTREEALAIVRENPEIGQIKKDAKRHKPAISVPNLDDLKLDVQRVAVQRIGHQIDDQLASELATQIQSQHREYRQNVNQQEGGTVEEPPDTTRAVSEMLRDRFSREADQMDALTAVQHFQSMLGTARHD